MTSGENRLWVITPYYAFDDPPGFKRRLNSYREFRRRLQAPLITVELSLDGAFHLQPADADILVQLRGGAILWQKERLLNFALASLPGECDAVAWVDCDIVLLRNNWVDETLRLLASHTLVQPFRRVHFMEPPGYSGGLLPEPPSLTRLSAAHGLAHNLVPEEYFLSETGLHLDCHCGVAWAATRETLEKHLLYDAMILGSGDKVMFFAACGRSEDAVRAYRMSPRHTEHYLDWAHPFAETARKRISYVDGVALHLWHGDLAHRRYDDRYHGFHSFSFDPYRDLSRTADGVWNWSSDKPALHCFVQSYFDRRKQE